MRFSIIFGVNVKFIPVNYQRLILSLLKKSFQLADKNLYNCLYLERKNRIKPFTFSVYFPDAKFENEKIILNKNEFILNFSTFDIPTGLNFYNGLLKYVKQGFFYKTEEFKLNLKAILLKREYQIKENKIRFKTLSPVVVRKHDREKNRDEYLTLENSTKEEFEKVLNSNMANVFKEFLGREYRLNIEPVELKKVAVKISEEGEKRGYIPANIGQFYLEGEKVALDFVYKAGLGARRSFGFGMLEVVKENEPGK